MSKYLLIPLCGLLWAWAGAKGTTRAWRWVLIPILISLALWNPWCLLLAIPASMGYGEESWLRKLVKSNFLTRLILGATYGLSVYTVTRNIYSVILPAVVTPVFAVWIHKEPQVKILGKMLNTEEMIIGAMVGLASCL